MVTDFDPLPSSMHAGSARAVMPFFFMPFTASTEEAELTYSAFLQEARHPLAHPGARLFRISFRYEDRLIVGEVGADLAGWPEPLGPVVAIVETTLLLYVHTRPNGSRLSMPILVSPFAI